MSEVYRVTAHRPHGWANIITLAADPREASSKFRTYLASDEAPLECWFRDTMDFIEDDVAVDPDGLAAISAHGASWLRKGHCVCVGHSFDTL